ncbi:MAG TPA: phosphoenolpyruvate carboxylase, partial [Longimicrobiales bacterium]|nr:phosphoenolpyruvate carboxylase [Longimicrobiales bacterium]
MGRWEGLEIESEGTGISRPLSEHVNLLGAMLGEAVRRRWGQAAFDRVERLRRLCKASGTGDDERGRERAAEIIAGSDREEIVTLLRAFTTFFHLVNQAEKQEIIRVNRERSRPGPRPESLEEVVGELRDAGMSLESVRDLLAKLDVQPTLTAHPTEARPPAVLKKQQAVGELLLDLRRSGATPVEEARLRDRIFDQIALLLTTDEIRAERPGVNDEVEQGLYFLLGSIWEAVPRLHDDLTRALEGAWGEAVEVPAFLRYRSWIGSDRDGNPKVTASVTRWTLAEQRRRVLTRYRQELEGLLEELSVSERQVGMPRELRDSVRTDLEALPGAGALRSAHPHEPFRLKVAAMDARLRRLLADDEGEAYDARAFVSDLRLIGRALERVGLGEVARHGHLSRVLVLARTFGFHLATLDVRQHSAVHE